MELVLEQQGSCRAELGGGLEWLCSRGYGYACCRAEIGGGLKGLGWSSREAARERAAAGAAEKLQRRGRVLVYSV